MAELRITITEKETKRIPELLKEQPSVNPQNLDKVSSLHYKSMTETTIPLSEMNAHDIQLYYNWLISQGKEPICLSDNNKLAWKTNKDLFMQDISEKLNGNYERITSYDFLQEKSYIELQENACELIHEIYQLLMKN